MDDQIISNQESQAPRKTRVADSKVELERQYATFAVLFALGSVLVAWRRWDVAMADPVSMPIHIAMMLASVGILVRPVLTLPLVFLSLLHVVHGLVALPNLPSAELIWTFFSATICCSYLTGIAINRSYKMNAVELYRSIAPCLRVMFIVALTSMAFARLNWDFVHVTSSPVAHALTQFRGGEVASPWIVYFTISIMVVVDLAIGVALLIPSLRRFAVGFGSCYFAWQALIGFGDARMTLPLFIMALFLFTSTELVNRMYENLYRWIPIPAVRSAGVTVVTIVVGVLAGAIWWHGRTNSPDLALPVTGQQIVGWAYIIFVLVWMSVLLFALIDERPRLTWVSLLLRNPIQYVLLMAMFVVAASPYIGFGKIGRLVDHSGFAVHGGTNNHLLLPQTQLVNFEADLVEVTHSTDPYLQSIAESGALITWFEFVNYVADRPETAVSFVRGDGQFAVERAGDIEELSEKNGWLLRKLVAFGLSNRSMQPSRVVAQP